MKNSGNKSEAAPLRQKAEELLKEKRINSSLLLSEFEKQKLIHELSVHQIELELQNEELALAQENMQKVVEELKLSNSRNSALLKAIPDLIFRINNDGVFLDFQAQTTSDLYVHPDKIIGRKLDEILPPYIVDLISGYLRTILETGELQVFEYALTMSAGVHYFEARMAISNTNEIVTIIRNITERKLADEKLRQSEERYKRITEGLTDYLYTVNVEDGKVVETIHNEACFAITGYTQKELSDDPYLWITMVVPEERAFVAERASGILEGKEQAPCELRVRHENGEIRWIKNTIILHYGSNGELVSYDGVLKDITERKQIESALIDSEEKFSVAFRTSPYAIIITQAKDGQIIDVNDSFFTLTGYTREETINNTTTQMGLWVDEEIRDSVVAELLAGRSLLGKEFRFKKKNEQIITGLFSAQHIRIKNNSYILSSIADITERVYAEQELVIANKELAFQNEEKEKRSEELIKAKEHAEESDRLKSAFLCNMSHEIRTPMNGILGFSELLKEPKLTGEQQQEYLSVIAKSCDRLLNIINDIVDISIIDSGQREVSISQTNVNELIEYIHSVYMQDAEQKGLQMHFKNALPTNEAIINTDKKKLDIILSNLVKNALKFTTTGYIEIGYDSTDSPTDCSMTELTFFVKDTGIGIPKDRQEAIFERFMQADVSNSRAFQGAGLGLAITKAYVEMLGGKIWVESKEENRTKAGGSTFYFTLPNHVVPIEKEVTKSTVLAEDDKNRIDKLKVLIAEDDEASEKFLTFTVRSLSKEILKASTGVEAVETCRNNPDIDLVIMDIRMPEMDGYEATRQIRLSNKDVVIIAQTAYALSGDREKALEAGCNEYLSKPTGKSYLIELIKKHFNKSGI